MQTHTEAFALLSTYAGSGEDQTLIRFARETLPAVETPPEAKVFAGIAKTFSRRASYSQGKKVVSPGSLTPRARRA